MCWNKNIIRVYSCIVIILIIGLYASVDAGTAYIPIWQHGSGSTFFCNMMNMDTHLNTMLIYLYDLSNDLTYVESAIVWPQEAWITDTASFDGWYQYNGGRDNGFGWGKIESAGRDGTAFAWGAIYSTVSGKIIGLTVVLPTTGF